MREAVAFLTRLPAGGGPLTARAAPWFPLVGAVLGAAIGGAAVGLTEITTPLLAAALAVALELALTGALHADGLADSADGLGGRDREHVLAIMRDHAVGAYGACALILDLLVKAAAIAVLAERGEILPVIAAFAVSRAAPLVLAATLPPARPTGAGRLLDGLRPAHALAGTALAAAVAAATFPPALAAAAVTTAAVWWLARRRLQGVTGDVMGAAIELAATAALVVAAA